LRAGAVVVPSQVRAGDQIFAVDPTLAALLGGTDGTSVVGHPSIVVTVEAKRALWLSTGAAAVDMESGAVARVAQAHGLPFAVLRAICDPADRTLPPAALVALNSAGAIGLVRVIGSLLRHPGQFPALMHLANDAAAARRVLQLRARGIGAG
jgi:adenosylhomocysteine nucleosidase